MRAVGSSATRSARAGRSPDVSVTASGLPANQAHLRYRPEIDGLRAVAVLAVVFYHAALSFPGGFVGVDVFFVISGYLITKIIYDLTLERKFSFLEFYERRVRRLFPALFVMLIAVTLWSVTHMLWMDVRTFGTSLFAATTYLSNVYFYVASSYFTEAARTKPLLHTWSLAIEEQFYIVVPFLLFVVARFVPRAWHVAIIITSSLLSFALCLWLTDAHDGAAFYLLPPRAWELGLGAALAIAAPQVGRKRWLAELLGLGGIAAILFACFAFSDGSPFPGWRAAVPTLGTAAILSTGGRSGSLVERLLASPPFTFVGKISYSLYLWHWPVIVAFTYAAFQPIGVFRSAVAVLISIVLATVSWWFVERPFRVRRILPGTGELFAAAAIASVTAATIGAALNFKAIDRGSYPRQLVAFFEDPALAPLERHCFSLTLTRARAGQLCVRGARNVPASFIFAGDSHAASLSDALFAAAASRGLSGVQFTSNGVIPLPGFRSSPQDIRNQQPLTQEFVSYLQKHRQLQTVIVTGFWSYRATGRSFRRAQIINYDAQYDGSGPAYSPIALRHALERLVDAFPDRQFVFLDDTPSGDALNLRAYVRAEYNGLNPHPGLPRDAADAQRASYEPIFRALATQRRNVRYLPILNRICGPTVCPLFAGGKPIYVDGDHVTRWGAMLFEPALGAVFDRASTKPPRFEMAGSRITTR